MRHRIAAAGLAPFIAMILASPAHAVDRYIDDSGTDAGSCTSKVTPCKTISYAIAHGLSNDTLLVGGGSYSEQVTLVGQKLAGSDFNPPATQGAAIVDGMSGVAVTAKGADEIRDLTLRGRPAVSVPGPGTPTITHDAFDSSGALGHVEITSSGSAQVLGSTFSFAGSIADGSAAVYANTTGSVVVANSTTSNLTRGVWSQQASSTAVRDNAISVAPAPFESPTGVEVDGGPGTILRNRISVQGTTSSGMLLGGGDMTLHANVVTGASIGVLVQGSGHVLTMDSDVVTGNAGGVSVSDASTGLKLFNETITGNGSGPQVGTPGSVSIDSSIIGGTGVFASNGCTITYSRGPTTTGNSCQRFQTSANPQFVSATDRHLKATSPLIDAGNPAKPPAGATDADGRPRALDGNRDCVPRRDMGAYELSAPCAKPNCTLKAKSSKVSLKRRVIRLAAKCNENVAVTLGGTVKVKQHGKTKSRVLGPVSAKLNKNVAKTLKLKLPKSARKALANGAKESARFLLTATNGDAEKGTAKAKIKRLKPKT